MRDEPITVEYVIARLEEAGATLLALPARRPGPGLLRAQSQGWPVIDTANEAYGWTGSRMRPGAPDSARITRMDEALTWLEAIPQGNYVLRRIVGARALVSPLTGRHLFSWRRIAKLLGADERAVRRWHADGVRLIVAALREREMARRAA